jgi:hypothetical protein
MEALLFNLKKKVPKLQVVMVVNYLQFHSIGVIPYFDNEFLVKKKLK